jgi:hypothetical protein
MSANALSAHGTLLYRQSQGAGPFNVVGELRDISGPELSRNPIEVTAHNDVEEHFVMGIRRKGEVSLQVGFNLTDTSHVGLRDSWEAGDRDVWRIDFTDGSQWLFSGFVQTLGPQMPVDDAFLMDVTIRPTNTMTFIDP